MKNLFTVFVLVILSLSLSAQIVIERTDFYEVGDEIPLIRYFSTSGESFTTLFGADEPVFGDVNWSNNIVDTLRFFEPSETDFLNMYPEANCSYMNEEGFVIHMKITDSEVITLGVQAQQPLTGDPMYLTFSDSLKMHKFPFVFGESHSDIGNSYNREHISAFEDIIPPDYYGIVSALYDTISFEIDYSINSEFDEYGTMVFNGQDNLNGSFEFLREKRLYVTHIDVLLRSRNSGNYTPLGDTPFADQLPMELPMIDSIFSLNYWTKDYKYPLAEIFTDNSYTNVIQVNYRYCDKSFVSSNLYTVHRVYPNPAINSVNFVFDNLAERLIYVYSETGVLVDVLHTNSNHIEFNTEELSQGNYLYKITDKNGIYLSSGRFLILNK